MPLTLPHPTPRAFVGPHRCPKCGKVRRLSPERTPRRRFPRPRVPAGWRRDRGGLYVPETVASAGDRLIAADQFLDASGNVMLSDGTGDECCCPCDDCGVTSLVCCAPEAPAGSPKRGCEFCGPGPSAGVVTSLGCTPSTIAVTISGITVCDCHPRSEAGTLYYAKANGFPSGTFTLPYDGALSHECEWEFGELNTSRFTMNYYGESPASDCSTSPITFNVDWSVEVWKIGAATWYAFIVASRRSTPITFPPNMLLFEGTYVHTDECCVTSFTMDNDQTSCPGPTTDSAVYGIGGTIFVEIT